MSDLPDEPSPMAIAMEWVARILAVAVEMVLPGLGGQWLDQRLGTGFLALAGFGLGISAGLWHLIVMTRAAEKSRQARKDVRGPDK